MEGGTLETLNANQRQAVEHGIGTCVSASPLLIIAGAGSGKTNTLAHRVAHILANGVDSHRILLLTFSRRAAQEMKRRVEGLAGRMSPSAGKIAWAGTFHAIGAKLLRVYARQIDLDPAFTILDRADAEDALNFVRNELGFSATESRFPTKATCLSIYSRAVNAETPLEDLLDEVFPYCRMWADQLRDLFTGYVEAKQAQNLMDYDDLLLYWARMMQVEEVARDIGNRFDHVLVDEYQDTNRLQASILLALKPEGTGLAVVGDDAQAIYSFRAATIRNILEFPGHFNPPARIVTLERNYRSSQPILSASNAVIGEAKERYSKNLWSDRASDQKPVIVSVPDGMEQARYVAGRVLENRERGIRLKSQAVLFRAGHHSAMLELELARRNIPFVKFGGLRFLDTAHVKDVLSVLRWSTNPRDSVAAFRVLNLFPGIGPKTARNLIARIATGASLLGSLADFLAPATARTLWQDFVILMQRLEGNLAGWPSEYDAVLNWYEPLLEATYEDPKPRKSDLEQLGQIAATSSAREQFLTDLTLDPPQAGSDEPGPPLIDEDYLILSSIHSAKGLEWTSVFVLNTVDGCIPIDLGVGSPEEVDEERRLLYVAMTRAKDELHLIQPSRFFVYGQPAQGNAHVTASRTRFIPSHILSHFERLTWPAPGVMASARATIGSVDIKSKMRSMWR